MATIRRSGESKCFSMARELAQHRGLSFEARGLMAYLLSKPTNWQAKLTDIEKEGNIGREQRRRIIGELEKAGYIERKQLRDEHGRINYEMIVHEDVLPEESRTCETDRAVTAQTETPFTYIEEKVQERELDIKEVKNKRSNPDADASPPRKSLACADCGSEKVKAYKGDEIGRCEKCKRNVALKEIAPVRDPLAMMYDAVEALLMDGNGLTKDSAAAFLGKQIKTYSRVDVIKAGAIAIAERPADAKAYIVAILQNKGNGNGRQSKDAANLAAYLEQRQITLGAIACSE